MKKNVLGILFITICFQGFTQSNSLGINAGFGHSWIKNHRKIQFNPAGNFGVSFVHSTKSNFGFGADLKFSLEGGQKEYTSGSTMFEHTIDLNYLRIPMKAIYFLGNFGQKIRPKVHLGPTFGILLKATDKVINKATGNVIPNTEFEYHNLDIGLTGGVGFNYRLVKNTWFTTDLNYFTGFTGIRNTNNSSLPRLINNNLALNFGVNWGIGK